MSKERRELLYNYIPKNLSLMEIEKREAQLCCVGDCEICYNRFQCYTQKRTIHKKDFVPCNELQICANVLRKIRIIENKIQEALGGHSED
jgi:hypothetical protein